MAYLLLDLDLTVFTTLHDQKYLHESVQLDFAGIATAGFETFRDFEVWIINLPLLTELIILVYEQHDGIIIFTAGLWQRDSIKNLLKTLPDLTDKARIGINQCCFIGPSDYLSDKSYSFENLKEVAYKDKNERFNHYLSTHPQLNNYYYVMLDDNILHLRSFKDNSRVTPVLATTLINNSNFYQTTLVALDQAKKLECLQKEKLMFLNNSSINHTSFFFSKDESNSSGSDLSSTVKPVQKFLNLNNIS